MFLLLVGPPPRGPLDRDDASDEFRELEPVGVGGDPRSTLSLREPIPVDSVDADTVVHESSVIGIEATADNLCKRCRGVRNAITS